MRFMRFTRSDADDAAATSTPPVVAAPVEYVFGVDLAQQSDFTAVSLLKLTPTARAGSDRAAAPYGYDLISLARYRGESYPSLVKRIGKLAADPRLRPTIQVPPRAVADGAFYMGSAPVQAPKPRIVLDATGVGRAVVDMFVTPEVRAVADIVPLTITAGESWRKDRWGNTGLMGYWVAKRELVSLLVARLQGECLRFIPGDRLSAELEDELRNFRLKLSKANNEQFEAREGKTDDLVLAVSMAVWASEVGKGKRISIMI
jgi:hypothetical protein